MVLAVSKKLVSTICVHSYAYSSPPPRSKQRQKETNEGSEKIRERKKDWIEEKCKKYEWMKKKKREARVWR